MLADPQVQLILFVLSFIVPLIKQGVKICYQSPQMLFNFLMFLDV